MQPLMADNIVDEVYDRPTPVFNETGLVVIYRSSDGKLWNSYNIVTLQSHGPKRSFFAVGNKGYVFKSSRLSTNVHHHR